MSTTAVLSLLAVIVTACAASSVPPPGSTPVYVTLPDPESSSTAKPPMASNTGASFTAVTVNVKVRDAVFTSGETPEPSSVAVTVIVAAPFASAVRV